MFQKNYVLKDQQVQIIDGLESEKFILASTSSDEAPSFGFDIVILSIKSQIIVFLLQCTSAISFTCWQYNR